MTEEHEILFADAKAFYLSVVFENDMVISITKNQAISIINDKYKRFRIITCINEKAEQGIVLFQSGNKFTKNAQN